jgi:hypothetical protein
MRKVFYFTIVCLCVVFTNCSNYKSHYNGYVYYKNIPVQGVLVREKNNTKTYTYTNSKGYFILAKNPNIIDDLVFKKESFKTDTVKTVWSQHGEKIEYQFVTNRLDTIFLKKNE